MPLAEWIAAKPSAQLTLAPVDLGALVAERTQGARSAATAPIVVQVPPTMKVSDFINKVLSNNHHTSFPVVDNRRLHGLLLPRVRRLPLQHRGAHEGGRA